MSRVNRKVCEFLGAAGSSRRGCLSFIRRGSFAVVSEATEAEREVSYFQVSPFFQLGDSVSCSLQSLSFCRPNTPEAGLIKVLPPVRKRSRPLPIAACFRPSISLCSHPRAPGFCFHSCLCLHSDGSEHNLVYVQGETISSLCVLVSWRLWALKAAAEQTH